MKWVLKSAYVAADEPELLSFLRFWSLWGCSWRIPPSYQVLCHLWRQGIKCCRDFLEGMIVTSANFSLWKIHWLKQKPNKQKFGLHVLSLWTSHFTSTLKWLNTLNFTRWEFFLCISVECMYYFSMYICMCGCKWHVVDARGCLNYGIIKESIYLSICHCSSLLHHFRS